MVVIVDYGLGNLASIANMGRKAGAELVISSDPAVIATADKLILPGVGAFDHGMAQPRRSRADSGASAASRAIRASRADARALPRHAAARPRQRGRHAAGPRLDRRRQPPLSVRRADGLADQGAAHGLELHRAARRRRRCSSACRAEPRFYFVHSYHLVCDDPGRRDVLDDLRLSVRVGHPARQPLGHAVPSREEPRVRPGRC